MPHWERLHRSAFEDFRRAARLEGEEVLVGDPEYGVGRRHLLFTYGTMKLGFRNHARIAGKARFVCATRTREFRFNLYTKRSRYLAPVMVEDYSDSFRVTGEVYEIDGPLLEIVDAAEGHPHVYARERIFVEGVEGPVWAYLFQNMMRTRVDEEEGIFFDEGARTKTFIMKE